jgi:putative superfamily III holin-X
LSTQLEDPAETPIAELVHQLVEDGRSVARAELNLYREIALYRIGKAKAGAIAITVGALLALAAFITLFVMLAEGLAVLIGPVAAGLVVAGIAAIAAFLLIRFGAGRLAVLGGDMEERHALERGESKA